MSSKETQDHDGRASYAHLRNHSAEQSGESEHRSHVSVVTLKADKDAALQNVQSGQRDYKALSLMKYVSLVLLTLQNAALILVMRYVRTRPGDMFMATTAVIMAEIFKLVVCIIIVIFQEKGVGNMLRHLNGTIVQQPLDCLKISVPAIIYMIQNNLLYVALSNLEATTFQVSYQLKILTTALFSVTMLNKKLSRLQWVSLVILFTGIAVVQLQPASGTAKQPSASRSDHISTYQRTNISNTKHLNISHRHLKIADIDAKVSDQNSKISDKISRPAIQNASAASVRSRKILAQSQQILNHKNSSQNFSINRETVNSEVFKKQPSPLNQNRILGLLAVVVSAILSGFAGVYFEKLLKGTPQSLYVRNIQLGVVGVVFGSLTMIANDGLTLQKNGFFFGYDWVVWIVIALQSFGGIMVAVVVKYADNILKGFASSLAIVLSCVLCMYLFDFELTALFSVGSSLVMISVYIYSKYTTVHLPHQQHRQQQQQQH